MNRTMQAKPTIDNELKSGIYFCFFEPIIIIIKETFCVTKLTAAAAVVVVFF